MAPVDDALDRLHEALAIAWPEGDHAEPNVFTEALAALSEIERRVQDMETALRGLLVETEPEQHRGTEPHPERGMCVWCDARAALAGPDTPADRQPEEPT